jgi:hypothetical protein
MIKYEITHLDGTPWLENVGDFMGKWRWISETMAGIFECDPGDVEVMETEAHGDVLIVLGKAVGLLPAPRTGARRPLISRPPNSPTSSC